MEPVAGVDFLLGDFTEDAVLEELERALAARVWTWCCRTWRRTFPGLRRSTRHVRSIFAKLALDFAVRHLKPGGQFVVKVFQGEGFMEFRKQMEAAFASVQVRKPKASRDRSAEVYLLGKGPRRP
jgi:23S rRNA (uridine2552-2'-O)-methyltransferase